MKRTYWRNGTTYEVQFYKRHIILESPEHDLIIANGYADMEAQAIKVVSDYIGEEGHEYDREDVDNYIEEHWILYVEMNIGRAQLTMNV